MQEEISQNSKYEHKGLEKVFKNPDGEELADELLGTSIDDEEDESGAPAFNITFKTNAKELEEFASHFEEDFEQTYENIRSDNNQATDKILETKLSINEQYKLLGLDGPFEAAEVSRTKCIKLADKDWKAESRRLSSARSSTLGTSNSMDVIPEITQLNGGMFKYARLPGSRMTSGKEQSHLSGASKMVKILPNGTGGISGQKPTKSTQEGGTPTTDTTKGEGEEGNKTLDEEAIN